MRSAVIPALLLAVCGPVHAEDPSAPFLPSGIGVYFSFEQTPSPITTSTMQAELASIMNPLGLSFVWKQINGETPATFPDLIVIRFKGSCEGIVGPHSESGAGVLNDTTLAATKTSAGQVMHFTEVHCDAMRHYLAADVISLGESERDTIYGRALGRIIAHEMYHVFGDTEKHGAGGIARPSYSRHDLLQRSFGFEPKEAEALRTYASRTLRPDDPESETDQFPDSTGRDSTSTNSVSGR